VSNGIPTWIRDTIPAWVFIAIAVWFITQRALERRDPPETPVSPKPYPRPVRDLRVVFPTLGFVAVSAAQLMNGGAAGSVNDSLQTQTKYTLAIIMILGAGFTLAAVIIKAEWWSTGCELAGCILLSGGLLVYTIAYIHHYTNDWPTTIGTWLTASLLVGNAARAVQLFRWVG